MTEKLFLIWSNEHRVWWGPDHNGYTTIVSKAGRYTRAAATDICVGANRHLEDDQDPNVIAFLAPECC